MHITLHDAFLYLPMYIKFLAVFFSLCPKKKQLVLDGMFSSIMNLDRSMSRFVVLENITSSTRLSFFRRTEYVVLHITLLHVLKRSLFIIKVFFGLPFLNLYALKQVIVFSFLCWTTLFSVAGVR